MGMAMKGAQQRTQKGQNVLDFNEEQARDYFEQIRWAGTPVCVHCQSTNVYRLQGKSTRAGLLECRECRLQFTVTVGSVMEDSHLPLSTWAKAFHLICSSKKGISALQLQRNLGLGSYRTAWFLAHRVREAMRCQPVDGMLTHVVAVDECYVGGKPRKVPGKRNRPSKKVPVVAAVETRDDGKVVCTPVKHVDSKTLCSFITPTIRKSAIIVTDELPLYRKAAERHADHQTVNHSMDEYVNRAGFTTNTAESFFALLERGVYGTFHHISESHMHRYCDEFSFRWNGRGLKDSERRDAAVKGVAGKRLMYKGPKGF